MLVRSATVSVLPTARRSGTAVCLTGVGLIAAGFWGRREVHAALTRERIVDPSSSTPVRCGGAARALAERIRQSTLAATAGRTYAETDPESEQQALWLQSTTLQTALMNAYLGSRIALLTIGLGAAFVVTGAGLAATARPA